MKELLHMKSESVKQKLNKKFTYFTIYMILIVVITTFIMYLINDKDKYIFGYSARVVVSGSMEPDIKTNSLNIIKLCDIDDINVGDVVCFNYSQDIIHRVIEKTDNNGTTVLHTKGDANDSADDIEVYNDMVIGKVVLTFNGIASTIEKYSIAPGKVDGVALSRNIITMCMICGLVAILVSWLINIITIIIRVFIKEDRIDENIDEYMHDIDELLLYKEMLQQLKEYEVENSAETRFRFITNRISRAKAEVEIYNMHRNIKEFKKNINKCIILNKVGNKIDNMDNDGKEEDQK